MGVNPPAAGRPSSCGSRTRLAFVDLSLSLGLVLVWMRHDAGERALPFWPYAVITLAVGVAGPLAYPTHRELRAARVTSLQRA
jgi:hypothetical protein